MNHIKSRRHDEEIATAFQIPKSEVLNFLHKLISSGTVVSNKLKPIANHMGYERIYHYEGRYCVISAIGTNGFIVSAYPRKIKGEL